MFFFLTVAVVVLFPHSNTEMTKKIRKYQVICAIPLILFFQLYGVTEVRQGDDLVSKVIAV